MSGSGEYIHAPQPIVLLDLGREMRGGQRQVQYLAKGLMDAPDFSPRLLCPNGPLADAAQADGVPVTLLPARLWHPDLWWTLYRTCTQPTNSACPPVLHTHDAHAALAGAVLKTLLPRITLIHSRRVSYAVDTGWRNWKYRKADAVAGVSADITRSLAAAGLDPARLHTIHSGIDPATYSPASFLQANQPFTFLAVGALTPQKGFTVLLDAAYLLEKQNLPPWKVRLVGDGPLRDPLELQRGRLGLESRVEMPGRRESRQELPLAHALVVPSVDGEGSSGTIKEGWASVLPVIASDLSSNTELITDGYSGLLFTTGSPETLARAMRRVLLDESLRADLVSGGCDTLPHFTAQHMVENTIRLYRDCTCSSPTNPFS